MLPRHFWENSDRHLHLPDRRMLLKMGRAMVGLYCASFAQVPKRITLDIDDTFDAVHGSQQLRLIMHEGGADVGGRAGFSGVVRSFPS